MYGMEHKLELDTAPITPDNAKDLEPLPRTLQEATQAFKKPDSMARKVLGDAFVVGRSPSATSKRLTSVRRTILRGRG